MKNSLQLQSYYSGRYNVDNRIFSDKMHISKSKFPKHKPVFQHVYFLENKHRFYFTNSLYNGKQVE